MKIFYAVAAAAFFCLFVCNFKQTAEKALTKLFFFLVYFRKASIHSGSNRTFFFYFPGWSIPTTTFTARPTHTQHQHQHLHHYHHCFTFVFRLLHKPAFRQCMRKFPTTFPIWAQFHIYFYYCFCFCCCRCFAAVACFLC